MFNSNDAMKQMARSVTKFNYRISTGNQRISVRNCYCVWRHTQESEKYLTRYMRKATTNSQRFEYLRAITRINPDDFIVLKDFRLKLSNPFREWVEVFELVSSAGCTYRVYNNSIITLNKRYFNMVVEIAKICYDVFWRRMMFHAGKDLCYDEQCVSFMLNNISVNSALHLMNGLQKSTLLSRNQINKAIKPFKEDKRETVKSLYIKNAPDKRYALYHLNADTITLKEAAQDKVFNKKQLDIF